MSLNRFARRTGKSVLRSLISAGWIRSLRTANLRNRVKIFYAHYFGPSRPYLPEGMAISLERLRTCLKSLAERFEFVPLDAMIASGCDDGPALRDAVAITLDDGYDLLREGAYDIFEEFSVPVTTFVVIDAIDNQNLIWPNKLRAIQSERGEATFRAKLASLQSARGHGSQGLSPNGVSIAELGWSAAQKDELADELWRLCDMPALSEYLDRHRPYHTLAQLRSLIARGHAVGLHSRTHPFCDRLTRAGMDTEFVRAADWLKHQLGVGVLPMAYPFGVRLAPELERRLADEAALTCALGTRGLSKRPAAPMALRRVSLEGDFEYNLFAASLKP